MSSPTFWQLECYYNIKKKTSAEIYELSSIENNFNLDDFCMQLKESLQKTICFKELYKQALEEIFDDKYMQDAKYLKFYSKLLNLIENFSNHYMIIIPLLKDFRDYSETSNFPNENLFNFFM